MARPKVCVITGAGASYDVFNGVGRGYGESNERRPPLTSELFDSRFFDELTRYPGAMVLAQVLGPLAQAGALNLEQQLREYQESDDRRVKALSEEVAPYIRDVVQQVSGHHRATPGCYIQLAKKLLSDRAHDVLFLTTNYDDLLERALEAFDPRITFAHLDSYVAPDRAAKVVKIHGSVDWFFPLGPAGAWRDAVNEHDLSPEASEVFLLRGMTAASGSMHSVPSRGNEAWWLYPQVAAPVAGKSGTESFRCPPSHTEAAAEFLRDCEKVLIVGSSGLDSDLLEFLDERLGRDAKVHLVGGGSAAFQAAAQFGQSVDALTTLFDTGTVHAEGFREYVKSEAFDQFANA